MNSVSKKTKETTGHSKREIKALKAFYKDLATELNSTSSLYELQEDYDSLSNKINFTNKFSDIWSEASNNEDFQKYIKNPSPTHKFSTLKKWIDFINNKLESQKNFWSANEKSCIIKNSNEELDLRKLSKIFSDTMFDINLRNLLDPFSNPTSKNLKVSKSSSLYRCTQKSEKEGGCKKSWNKVSRAIKTLKKKTQKYFKEWKKDQEEKEKSQEQEYEEELKQLKKTEDVEDMENPKKYKSSPKRRKNKG